MARRKTVYRVNRRPVEGGSPPNRHVGLITVDLRVNFPPHVDPEDVKDLLRDTYSEVFNELAMELEDGEE